VQCDKVTQVIGAELGLEPIGSVAKRCGHNFGVSDNRVEGFAFSPAVHRRRHARS
jgi:hypothetical protein